MPDISERDFEGHIEAILVNGWPAGQEPSGAADAKPGDTLFMPGGYRRESCEKYDRQLCLLPDTVVDFILATQPETWEKLRSYHGAEVKQRFLQRLASEIESRGTLDVLRRGVKDSGCGFKLVFFRPASGLNPKVQKLYEGNIFTVVRQLHFSEKDTGKSLDMGLFLNGIPLFTAELKDLLTGQNVKHAVSQYRLDRDPREPLFRFRRCLAHFCVDSDLVLMTTRLQGPGTKFLPFNKGYAFGAGNPPKATGYATSYLWDQVWARDSVLNLLQYFVHEVEEEDDAGRKHKKVIFPRFHQLDCVRRLIADAREHGQGQRYLIQHSAGSGKSNSIAWLAHQLASLHDDKDKRVFDSIVIISDRRVIDRQLQGVVKSFEQTAGLVENIDETSRQLKAALEAGKAIVVTTLQKFPVIAEEIKNLPGARFAVIIDEAHSSQTGESRRYLNMVFKGGKLEDAELVEGKEWEDDEDVVLEQMKSRGFQPNVSYFAFTATPKAKTLEMFGKKRTDGRFEPFSLYPMRQAIEENFILDVLENYTTYHEYWNLWKTIADDPRYDKKKAQALLRSFVTLHPHAIEEKLAIILEHFDNHVVDRINGTAKAMIVTRSRLHAVRFFLALRKMLTERGAKYKALVAFSGTVRDAGCDNTEAGLNGFPERQTAGTFKKDEYRFMVVAEKFQTGFDQPLLHTMYVDRKLGGVHAVQTLSRLNRVHPGKKETVVLDFANTTDEIQKAFEPYYEKTLLSKATDPNLLYDKQTKLAGFGLYSDAEVKEFGKAFFDRGATQAQVHALLDPIVERYKKLPAETQLDFRSELIDYVRLYAFLSQIVTFADADLERFYQFARLLRMKLPIPRMALPVEIQQAVDMESHRLEKTSEGKVKLAGGEKQIEPAGANGGVLVPGEELEQLSRIIKELNDRFGTDFKDEDKVFIAQLEESLAKSPALEASERVNPPENVRLTFDQAATEKMQDMIDTNFKFYKQVNDNPEFARYFLNWLFTRYQRRAKSA